MKTKTINVYAFDELSEDAKERAREWWREVADYPWADENLDSIKKFCGHFGVTLKDYRIGTWSGIDYTTDAANEHFRGVRLRDIDKDAMPTGYWLDGELWSMMHHVFKTTGDAKRAFEAALDAAFYAWRADWEYSLSDEAVDDALRANEYEFTEEGKRV